MKQSKKSHQLSVPRPVNKADKPKTANPIHKPDKQFEDLYLFANLTKQFQSLRINQPLLDKLIRHLFAHIPSDASFLHLPKHPQLNKLVLAPNLIHSQAETKPLLSKLRNIIPASLRRAQKEVIVINNSHADAQFASLSKRPYRLMAAGVRYKKNQYGWLGLIAFNQGKPFDQKQLRIVETSANQLAVMLANMAQYDKLEQFTINIVGSLVCAIEAKGAYTKGHSERVRRHAVKMARHMELDAKEIEALQWSTILHDIGKIGIPESILQKPSGLTEQEFALIKKHPQKGAAILKPIKQLGPSMAGIIHHHERYDGTGYPHGLKGEKIPMAARIIAVADTFDAITSPRSYHKRKGIREAMQELDQAAGTQLDPYLVRIFKTVYRK